jgi:hypothetical protein
MKRLWIRLYTSVLNDPKILVLPDSLFRFWVNCLLTCGLSGDYLPVPSRLKILMRISERQVIANLKSLEKFALVEETPDGFRMHDWQEHQYDSDFSRDRMKRHRDGQKNVTVTAQSRAEADTEQKPLAAAAAAASPPAQKSNGNAAELPNFDAVVEEAIHSLVREGHELPERTVVNQFGRPEQNPAFTRLIAAIRHAEPRIRAARMPVAFARKVILDELQDP